MVALVRLYQRAAGAWLRRQGTYKPISKLQKRMTMGQDVKDGVSLVLIFAAAIAGESPLWAAGFVAAALLLQIDKIEALLRRLLRRERPIRQR